MKIVCSVYMVMTVLVSVLRVQCVYGHDCVGVWRVLCIWS